MKKAIFIRGHRAGYSPEQCEPTMTVGELIEQLKWFDEDTPIFIKNYGGYTYGEIREEDIEEGSYGEEE